MVSEDAKYSHISVSSDDEDEVVIHAGIRGDDKPVAGSRPGEEQVDGDGLIPDSEGATERSTSGENAAGEEVSAARESHPADSYRETTEEDLDQTSMSTMQKAIIAVALLAIVGFAIYYSFLR